MNRISPLNLLLNLAFNVNLFRQFIFNNAVPFLHEGIILREHHDDRPAFTAINADDPICTLKQSQISFGITIFLFDPNSQTKCIPVTLA